MQWEVVKKKLERFFGSALAQPHIKLPTENKTGDRNGQEEEGGYGSDEN